LYCSRWANIGADAAACANGFIDLGFAGARIPSEPRASENPCTEAAAPTLLTQTAVWIHGHREAFSFFLASHQGALLPQDQHARTFFLKQFPQNQTRPRHIEGVMDDGLYPERLADVFYEKRFRRQPCCIYWTSRMRLETCHGSGAVIEDDQQKI
jgi:hypothetical protein